MGRRERLAMTGEMAGEGSDDGAAPPALEGAGEVAATRPPARRTVDGTRAQHPAHPGPPLQDIFPTAHVAGSRPTPGTP